MSADQLCDLIKRSGLLGEEELNALVAKFAMNEPEGLCSDAALFAEFCIERGKLTRWQTKMLLAKKYKGFMVGDYRLLDHDHGRSPGLFRGQHNTTHQIVDILVLAKPNFVVMKSDSFIEMLTQ